MRELLVVVWFLALARREVDAAAGGPLDLKCAVDLFQCANQRCVPNAWRCDGDNDCGDGSDEDDCGTRTCAPFGQFLCSQGKCIRQNWHCDGENDCGDNSDEIGCPERNKTCKASEFSCAVDKKCIPKSWMCDKDNDCSDGSDEVDCKRSTCGVNEFACKNGKCIQARWQCDQDDDCGDHSDEDASQCPAKPCSSGSFTCANKRCIPQQWICDGDNDCMDNSDESSPTCTKAVPAICRESEFACKTDSHSNVRRCILKRWRCDGEMDCEDASDEDGCPAKPTCSSRDFTCPGTSGKCVVHSRKCDGVPDCSGGEDEHDCGVTCTAGQFKCSEAGPCIPNSKVCDRVTDCPGKQDEPMNCFIDECRDHNGHCMHVCNDSAIGYSCSCHPGYELEANQRTCKDLNECAIPGSCSQICENTKGSYKCSCEYPYEMHLNGKSCKAVGPKPYLIFSDRNSIRSVNFDSTQYREVISGLRSVVGVAFDAHDHKLYWTDNQEKAIYTSSLSSPDKKEILHGDVQLPDGIAVDWVGRKLYWPDAGRNIIEVSELNGDSRLVLINEGLDEPRDTVVDPARGYLYWSDWGKEPKISRISMDGDRLTRQVIFSRNSTWPNGLAIDFTIDQLFWADARQQVIMASKMDGSSLRTVLETRGQHPFSISVFEDYIFWTDWSTESIYKANKFTGHASTALLNSLYSPMGVTVFHIMRQPAISNPCSTVNGGCSHLCLLTVKQGFSCHCPQGVDMLHDRMTCNTTSAMFCSIGFCLHGGECSDFENGKSILPKCRCLSGYTGRRCQIIGYQTEYQQASTPSPVTQPVANGSSNNVAATIGIVTGTAIGIILLFLAAAFIFHRRFRHNYSDRKVVNFDNPVYKRTTEDEMPIINLPFEDSDELSQC